MNNKKQFPLCNKILTSRIAVVHTRCKMALDPNLNSNGSASVLNGKKLPGYGESIKTVPTGQIDAYSKRAFSQDILDGLSRHLGLDGEGSGKRQKIILLGHDRGARVAQRILFDLDSYPQFDVVGACLADIVPITVQFASLADPANAASTFHWYVFEMMWGSW